MPFALCEGNLQWDSASPGQGSKTSWRKQQAGCRASSLHTCPRLRGSVLGLIKLQMCPRPPSLCGLQVSWPKVDTGLTSEKQRAGQMERCQLYSGLHPAAPGNKQTPTAWHGAAEGALHGKPELSTSSEWPKAMA